MSRYVSFPGAPGSYLSSPSSTAMKSAGSQALEYTGTRADWTPPAEESLTGRWVSTANRSTLLRMGTGGKPVFYWSPDGSAVLFQKSTVAVPYADGGFGGVRASLDVSDGSVLFESFDGTQWNTLDDVSGQGATTVHPGTSDLEICSDTGGTGGCGAGDVYRIRQLVGGSPVFDYDPAVCFTIEQVAAGSVTAHQGAGPAVLFVDEGDPPETLTYVALGDSTTAPRAGVVGYCDLLGTGLAGQPPELQPPFNTIVNSGVGGYDSADILAGLTTSCLNHSPQVVSLLCGINDHAASVAGEPAPRVSLDQYERNLRLIVATLQAFDHGTAFNGGRIKVVLMTPTWVVKSSGVSSARLALYAEVVRRVSQEMRTGLVDLFAHSSRIAGWDDPTWRDLTTDSDGVHPNSTAWALMYPFVRDGLHACLT